MKSAKEAYRDAKIGALTALKSPSSKQSDLQNFQGQVAELKRMERQRLIKITMSHRESYTGYSFVSIVMFEKLE